MQSARECSPIVQKNASLLSPWNTGAVGFIPCSD
jgi:hypothetical protein